jgi:hypothetical protein
VKMKKVIGYHLDVYDGEKVMGIEHYSNVVDALNMLEVYKGVGIKAVLVELEWVEMEEMI